MDLSKLDKNEQVAARVYLRRRRKAYDIFFFLQDLKVGDYISSNETTLPLKIQAIQSPYDGNMGAYDFVIHCMDTDEKRYIYAFGLKAYIGEMLHMIVNQNNYVKDASAHDLKLCTTAKILYGK